MSEENRVALYWPKRTSDRLNKQQRRRDPSSFPKKKHQQTEIVILDGGCLLYRAFHRKCNESDAKPGTRKVL
jgi:hypothetical protein